MRIESMRVSGRFRYLWLKRVTGVNLSVHCARCLRGAYDRRVSPGVGELSGADLEPGVHYLCGVSSPYRWADNFHMAFVDCPGSTATARRNGVEVVVSGARELPIDGSCVDASDPNSRRREYATCRNWQFASWLARHPELLA